MPSCCNGKEVLAPSSRARNGSVAEELWGIDGGQDAGVGASKGLCAPPRPKPTVIHIYMYTLDCVPCPRPLERCQEPQGRRCQALVRLVYHCHETARKWQSMAGLPHLLPL